MGQDNNDDSSSADSDSVTIISIPAIAAARSNLNDGIHGNVYASLQRSYSFDEDDDLEDEDKENQENIHGDVYASLQKSYSFDEDDLEDHEDYKYKYDNHDYEYGSSTRKSVPNLPSLPTRQSLASPSTRVFYPSMKPTASTRVQRLCNSSVESSQLRIPRNVFGQR